VGFFLLDNPNPHGPRYYATVARKLAAVIHITAGLQDLDGGGDNSCEATARYAATTDRQVSWHGGSDTDTYLYLLPPRYVAWHVLNYNTATYGWEISKGHTDWRDMPAWWVEATLRRAADGLRPVLRELGIPIRKATRAELDHAIATGGPPVGLISHAELQPADRTDPGWVRGVDTFPWARFLELLRGESPRSLVPLIGEDTVILRRIRDSLTATLSGGILTGVGQANADATNAKANGGLILGVSDAEFADAEGKSNALLAAARLQPRIVALLEAQNATLARLAAAVENGTKPTT
jgi:hypothetical protein